MSQQPGSPRDDPRDSPRADAAGTSRPAASADARLDGSALHLVGKAAGLRAEITGVTVVCAAPTGADEHGVAARGTGGRFDCTLPLGAALDAVGVPGSVIDLFVDVTTTSGGPPLRLRLAVGSLTADGPNGFPVPYIHDPDGRRLRPAPYRTAAGDLSIRVRRVPPQQRREAPAAVRRLVHAWLRRAARRTDLGRRQRAPLPADNRKVYYLIRSCFGLGGTVRTVVNNANFLAGLGYDVEIVSLLRPMEEPAFPIDPRVKVTVLFDERSRKRRSFALNAVPGLRVPFVGALAMLPDLWASLVTFPDGALYRRASVLTDVLLVSKLQRLEPGVLMTTRPSLNVLAARFASPAVVTIGQEHLNFPAYSDLLRSWLVAAYPRLDALAVLTSGDEQDYSRALAGASTVVRRIPNGLPKLPGQVSDQSADVMVAAGALTRRKGFDLLLPAFAEATKDDPQWQLRIFGGGGSEEESLRRQIADLGLTGRAHLMGRTHQMEKEMARASVFVLSSRHEGLPMVVIEAMGAGLAVVAFDCPRGPSDMIRPGVNGLLAPPEDVPALAAHLRTVIRDARLRRSMAEAARVTAGDYTLERISRSWIELMDELKGTPSPG